MMPDLDRIYDGAFFEEWGLRHERYVRSAELIAGVLVDVYRPQRVVDLGCGCGVYSHFLRRRGVAVVAIDGVIPPATDAFPVVVHQRDLTVPFANPWARFDMALCLEVAEHIPEQWVDPFLANITQFSDRLILSAAPPYQGGHHHVNEQPKRYWVERLAAHRFDYQRRETGQLMEIFRTQKPGYMWMVSQMSVYQRRAETKKDDQ